jgi:alpha-N-arabinofuranosidase
MSENLRASIKIHDKINHRVNPMIYGHFIEEMGNCIHNGIWANTKKFKENPMMDTIKEPGHLFYLRKDVFNALERLLHPVRGKTILRWPGGCFSDTYHWKNGIGPIEERPKLKNQHWNQPLYRIFSLFNKGSMGPDYNNQFGTDEFITMCEMIGVEPYININMGSGTPKEAAEWVEYVNGEATSEWGSKRVKIHENPYNVKYWGIGNEMWATWEKGHENNKTGTEHGKNFVDFAKAMRNVDPSIKLVASGYVDAGYNPKTVTKDPEWNRNLLTAAKEWIDYLALHIYVPGTALEYIFTKNAKFTENEDGYHSVMASPKKVEEVILDTWQDIVSVCGDDTSIRITFDEWNLYYYAAQALRADYRLMDGLWVASVLNIFNKLSEICPMANLAQFVNVLGLMSTNPCSVVLSPSYHVFDLYWNHAYLNYLDFDLSSPGFKSTAYGNIPSYKTDYIELTPTISDDKRTMSIFVLNKHLTHSIYASVDLSELGELNLQVEEVKILNHKNPFILNTDKEPNKVILQPVSTSVVAIDGERLIYSCPAHSVTLIKLKINQ